MTDILKQLTISAPIDKVWAALTDEKTLADWMGDDSVRVDLQVSGGYWLFDQQTIGRFTLIQAPNLLEYTWRQISWDADWEDSLVRWELTSAGNQTQVRLVHNRFPNQEERDSHDEGWEIYWLGTMIEYLEAGS